MKKIFFIIIVLFNLKSYSQIEEGQDFCSPNEKGNYFPISIEKKKIIWKNTYYIETINGKKTFNGKEYTEIKQEWENQQADFIYLREEKNVVYQYEKSSNKETIRYNKDFKIGDKWKNAENTTEYEIITFSGELKTPFCEYKNLLVIQAKIGATTYVFYYLKGHGYIGATINEKLASCVTPKW